MGEIRGSVVESWEKVGKEYTMKKRTSGFFGDVMKIFRGVWVKEVRKEIIRSKCAVMNFS